MSLGEQMLGRVEEVVDFANAHKQKNEVEQRDGTIRAYTENATAVYYEKSHRIVLIADNDDWDGAVRAFRLLRDKIGFA